MLLRAHACILDGVCNRSHLVSMLYLCPATLTAQEQRPYSTLCGPTRATTCSLLAALSHTAISTRNGGRKRSTAYIGRVRIGPGVRIKYSPLVGSLSVRHADVTEEYHSIPNSRLPTPS